MRHPWIALLFALGFLGLGVAARPEDKDYSGKDLPQADFHGKDLSGANFSEANLFLANFKQAILKGANLRDANLKSASFTGADLTGADLTGAQVDQASFQETKLSKANLQDVVFNMTSLYRAVLRGANLRGTSGIDDLREADLTGADLIGADLSAAVRYGLGTTRIKGAKYDASTHFPAGFDPAAAGLKLASSPEAGDGGKGPGQDPAAEKPTPGPAGDGGKPATDNPGPAKQPDGGAQNPAAAGEAGSLIGVWDTQTHVIPVVHDTKDMGNGYIREYYTLEGGHVGGFVQIRADGTYIRRSPDDKKSRGKWRPGMLVNTPGIILEGAEQGQDLHMSSRPDGHVEILYAQGGASGAMGGRAKNPDRYDLEPWTDPAFYQAAWDLYRPRKPILKQEFGRLELKADGTWTHTDEGNTTTGRWEAVQENDYILVHGLMNKGKFRFNRLGRDKRLGHIAGADGTANAHESWYATPAR